MINKLKKIFDILIYEEPDLTWEEEVPLYAWVKVYQ